MKKALLTKLMLLLCALIAGSSSAWATDVTDELTWDKLLESGKANAYQNFSGKSITSSAVYAGNASSGSDKYIQLRTTNSNAGIVTTTSGGKLKSVTITFNSATTDRAIEIYGKNEAYTAATDLYGDAKGTLLKKIAANDDDKTLLVDGDYTFVGLRSSSGAIYVDKIEITWESGSGPVTPTCATPTFSPAAGAVESGTTVTISSTTEGASIYYTMGDDPADPTTSSTPYTAPIEITAATTIKAIAVKDGCNNSAVASASYTILSQQNISDISEVGTAYAVKGTVVATSAKGFVIGDGTGYVYTYLNAAPSVSVGNKVSISGTTGSYGHIIQFTNSATIKEAATSNYNGTPVVKVVDADGMAAYNSDYQLSDYVQFEGALAKVGNNYNITVGTATARISYPTDDQKSTLDALVGKTVRVKGYFAGFSGTTFTAMLESVEALAVPTITADNVTIEADATSGEIDYTVENPTGATLSAALTEGNWISNIAVAADKVTFDATANTGDERTATITLSYTGATDKVVTVTQKKYVAAATLPFAFDGGKADIETTDGLSQTGLGSDYKSSPLLKFDSTGDELVLKIGDAASVLNFDIKGNSFTSGTFTVQTSADGVTYSDLATYNESNLTSDISHQSFPLASTVRYIKWIFTEKATGNVALGRIGVDCEAVTVPADGYMTACYPSDIAFAGTGVTAYRVSAIGASYVEIEEIESALAYTPVILKASAGTYALNLTASPADVGINLLQVSDGTATTDDDDILYALAAKGEPAVVGFYKVKKNVKVPAGKAYLRVPVATSAPEFLGFGDATGINVVKGEGFMVNGEIYNLAGQRVAQPTKGLYIMNGKKVILK